MCRGNRPSLLDIDLGRGLPTIREALHDGLPLYHAPHHREAAGLV